LVNLSLAPGYYSYAHIPQFNSKPTVLKIFSEDGETPLPGATVFYPPGEEGPDLLDSSKTKFLYRESTLLFINLPLSVAGTKLECTLSLLACSDAHCLPINKRLSLSIPLLTPDTPKAEEQPWWPEYQALRKQNQAEKENISPAVIPASTDSDSNSDFLGNFKNSDAIQHEISSLSLNSMDPEAAEVASWKMTPRSALPGLEVQSLCMAILFGLLAGFILNFMPCMLPVIGLKLTAFIAAGGMRQDRAAIHSFRTYWLFFSGGVICWFIVLAFLVATLNIIWGQAFQNELLVLGMILVVFSLALSTFGFYTLPIISLRGSSSSPHQAFITGFLLTCLATPCSGPLLGGVLAWTFRQGPEISSLVFIAVGLGMVAPYLCLVAFPTLSRYCPRPGRWLMRLEILVGFFLLLTTGYLMFMLPETLLPWAIAMLIVITGTAIVIHYKSRFRHETHWKAFALSIVCLIALTVAWRVLIKHDTAPESDWMPFTVADFKENWGKKPIIMDFTADWCVNCKVLEKTVLTRERLEEWAERYGVVFIQADLTYDNPAAQAMLQALDSASIPVVALFPADDRAASPLVLRDLFTPQQMEKAVRKTFN
jgi:thiol:disulfide interchange protein DsbD